MALGDGYPGGPTPPAGSPPPRPRAWTRQPSLTPTQIKQRARLAEMKDLLDSWDEELRIGGLTRPQMKHHRLIKLMAEEMVEGTV